MLLTKQIEKKKEVSKEEYERMFEVLPPNVVAKNGFLVDEPMDHDSDTGQPRFQMFVEEDGKYYDVGFATKADFNMLIIKKI